MPGVINNGNLSAYFSCTNADATSVTVGVEVFGPLGGPPINSPGVTAISAGPGVTVLFGTGGAAAFTVDGDLVTGPVRKGSAPIVATSKTHLHGIPRGPQYLTNPPFSAWQLTIVRKTKQRGD